MMVVRSCLNAHKTHVEALQCVETGYPLPVYSKTVESPQKPSASKFRLTSISPLESVEQAAIFKHAAIRARADPRWGMLFAIPNGKAASSIREAVNAKRTGLKRGVPDMFLAVPVGEWHGMFVELKRIDGSLSDIKSDQADWLQRLQNAGYQTVVAFGWKAAVAEIEWYLYHLETDGK